MFVLTLIYLIIIAVIAVMIIWHSFETKNIYEKIGGILMLILILLRLFFIR